MSERVIPLPLDADGIPIDIGDEVAYTSSGMHGTVNYIEIHISDDIDYFVLLRGSGYCHKPEGLRHCHKPTVEDVLREFGGKYIQVVESPNPIIGFGNEIIGEEDPKEVIAEYAAKLRLKEDE